MRFTNILLWLSLSIIVEQAKASCGMFKESVYHYLGEKILYRYITCTNMTPKDDLNNQIVSILNSSCEILQISKSSLPIIKKEMFVSLNLTRMVIDAGVQIIQEKTFERSNISTIILDNNRIFKIENLAFKSFYIDTISLQNNSLSEITDQTFAECVNLRILNLQMNTITTIDPNAFKDLVILENLNLAYNIITNRYLDIFKTNKRLKYLNIGDNTLTRLDGSHFPTSLLEINAVNNDIVNFNISNLRQLQSLNLNSNKIFRINDCLNNLPALNYLHLSNNFLGKSKSEDIKRFSVLTNLTLLELDNNYLEYFNFSGIENLEIISLSDNYLTKLDFSELSRNLKSLNLSHNFLSSLKNISVLSKLSKLDVSYNDLSLIEYDSFMGLNMLNGLYLSHNSIVDLPIGGFRDLVELQYFDLSYNNLTNISSGSLSGLVSLKELDLSHNKLTYLNEDMFHYMKNLKMLNIAYNNLTNVNIKGILAHVVWLRQIDLRGNKWACKLLINVIKDSILLQMKSGDSFNVSNVNGIPCDENMEINGKPEDGFPKIVSSLNNLVDIASNISIKISVLITLVCLIVLLIGIKSILIKYSSQITTAKQFIYQKSESEPEVHLI
ncbi:protein artichoke-like [Diorhabda carinulata]|uniref:protein artichoke-like n=1 Tax=Diorhabda carinulata TaxID=1163345 RepID=UPI0025A19C03|nr:protein artichoke-like [Diorhabda carinulata]